jgi:hypothetical protein
MFSLRSLLACASALCAPLVAVRAVTLSDYARTQPIKIFIPTKGSVMPNAFDSPGHLQLGTKALILSGLGLTDLAGISQLTVDDGGRRVPVTAVENRHLYITHNELAALPDEMGALKNVAFLYAEYNRLRTLPRALLDMDSLIAMYFTGNRFTEIPELVFEMTWLRKLQFSKNQLTVLPEAIGRLTELRHFNIAENQIAVLPETIAHLKLLRVCDFSDNRLTRIPEAFGEIPIANQLRVRNNPLTDLPRGLIKMRATIDITGTKIDPAAMPAELRSKFSTEKPPGSKDDDAVVVKRPPKKR